MFSSPTIHLRPFSIYHSRSGWTLPRAREALVGHDRHICLARLGLDHEARICQRERKAIAAFLLPEAKSIFYFLKKKSAKKAARESLLSLARSLGRSAAPKWRPPNGNNNVRAHLRRTRAKPRPECANANEHIVALHLNFGVHYGAARQQSRRNISVPRRTLGALAASSSKRARENPTEEILSRSLSLFAVSSIVVT